MTAAFETPMTAATVRAFVDGVFFLRHQGALRDAAVEPRCTTCHTVPLVAEGDDAMQVSCLCRAGRVQVDRALEVAPLLLALGWNLFCARCHEPVVGDNDPSALTFRVTCPCGTRTSRSPVQ